MQLIKLSHSDKARYTEFVAQNNGSFLQSWDWGDWQKHNGRTTYRFFVADEGRIQLSAQVIEHTVPHLDWKYLYVPYGPIIGDQIANSKKQIVVKGLVDQLKQKFPSAIFIRLEPAQSLSPISYLLKPTPHIQPGKTLVLDLMKSEDELLAAMHPKTRYNIKVAQKHGVSIAIKDELSDIGAELISATAVRQSYKSQPAQYFIDLVKFLRDSQNARASVNQGKGNLSLRPYQAKFGELVLAVAIMIDFGKTRTYLFGGTSSEQKNVMAPYALHWQAILDAKAAGLTSYDFWGIETARGTTPGFVRFKLGFGGQQIEYPSCVDLINRPLQYQIYKLARMFT